MANIPFLNNAYFAAKVGIGTDNPVGKLTVSSAGGVNGGINLITTSSGSYAPIDFNTPAGLLGQFLATGSGFSNGGFGGNELILAAETSTAALHLAAIGTSGYVKFTTGGLATSNERMRITSAGNVGIGKTNPAYKLHVDNSSATPNLPAFFRGGSLFATPQVTDGQVVFGNDINTSGALGWDNSSAGVYLDNRWNNNIGFIALRTKTSGTPNEVMRITGPGNVGIGTTSPGHKLTVEGNIELGTGACS